MISTKFEDEIWIYFQTNLSPRTRKEYWNVVRDFDRLTGHDPLKLTRKEALNYYNTLIEKVNAGRLSYNTAVMRPTLLITADGMLIILKACHCLNRTKYCLKMLFQTLRKLIIY